MDGFSGPFSSLPGAGPGEGAGSGFPIGTGVFSGFAPEPIPTQVNYNMGDEWNYPDSPRSVYSQEHHDPDSEDEREYPDSPRSVYSQEHHDPDSEDERERWTEVYQREIAAEESAYRGEKEMDGW